MMHIKYIIIVVALVAVPAVHAGQNISMYTQKIANLEQRLKDCQQKKIELLQECDDNNCLAKITQLQGYLDGVQAEKSVNHRTISALQRTIAGHNRQLLASMSDEDKFKLKQLLQEYQELWQELCLHKPQENEGQPQTFELFFI